MFPSALRRTLRTTFRWLYWSFAATLILTGSSVLLGLVACFVFPFLPVVAIVFLPSISAFGGAVTARNVSPQRRRSPSPVTPALPAVGRAV